MTKDYRLNLRQTPVYPQWNDKISIAAHGSRVVAECVAFQRHFSRFPHDVVTQMAERPVLPAIHFGGNMENCANSANFNGNRNILLTI
jgi:hypothetical protein